VVGCSNATVGNIVRGSYMPFSENHGRTVYRKLEQVNGLDVLVYFWDDRDGPNFCGWWFGPKVGGDQVWAYNSERATAPPTTGWRVPYDGPMDTTFVVSMHSEKRPGDAQAEGFGQQPQAQQQPGFAGAQQSFLQAQQQQQQFDMQERLRQQQEELRKRQQMEVMRQQQLEELRRREAERRQREEEERRRLEEENRRRREEDERRRLEQHSALMARKAIQKVRLATPDNFDALKKEVEDTLLMELPKCGQQADRIREDAEKQLEQAKQRVESMKEELRIRKEQEETSKKLMAELAELVEKAEKDAARLKEVAAPAVEGKELEPAEAKDVSKAVGEVCVDAKASCKSCTEFIVKNRSAIEQAKDIVLPTREELIKLQHRLADCFKLIITATAAAKAVKEKAVKKARAAKQCEKRASLFDKYDKDKDGTLNKKEISLYAKGEFGFAVPAQAMLRILAQLASESAGVPKAKFQRLKMAIGIAREEEASRVRRKAAEERRKILEEKKKALQADISKVADSLDDVEPEVIKAEERVKPLAVEDLTGAEKVSDVVEETQEQLSGVRTEIVTVRRQIAELSTDVEKELAAFVDLESRKLQVKAEAYSLRLNQVEAVVLRARAHLTRLEQLELDKLSADVIKLMKSHCAEKKLSVEDFFSAVDKDKDGAVGKADFLAFFEGLEGCEFESEKLERLFGRFSADEGNGSLSQKAFLKLIRVYYKCVKETLLTTEMAVKEGKTLRRLDVDEVIAAHEGPCKDDSLGIMRMRGQLVRDGAMGWATVLGNTGGVFLEEGGSTWEVLKETPLTTGLEPDVAEVRKLKEGEKLEILEWDKKHEASGTVRLRVKVAGENASGWVTKALPDETKLLKPLKA